MACLRGIPLALALSAGLTACSAPEPPPEPGPTVKVQPLGQMVLGSATKVVATDGAAGDQLGAAVSIYGDLAAVGAPSQGAGSAYVYTRSGTTWALAQKITATDGATGDTFGVAVAMHHDTLLVGAGMDDDAGADSGSAYVFSRTGTTWAQQAKLTGADSVAGDGFGDALALDYTGAIIGAQADDDRGTDSGSAYVFSRTGTTWAQQAKLTASTGAAGDNFGGALALELGVALVGAAADDDRGAGAGASFVFNRTGTTWKQQQKLTASSGATGDALGSSVALRDDLALLGAPGDSDRGAASGAAHIFRRSGVTWVQQTKLTASNGKAQDKFGGAVSITKQAALVGATGDDAKTPDAGAAYVFLLSGGLWAEQYKLYTSSPDTKDGFGGAVSMSGDVALVGNPGDDDKGSGSGSATFQQLCLGQGFVQRTKQLMPGGTTNDQFGAAAAMDGEWALLTAPYDDDAGTDSGTAFIYRRNGTSWSMAQKLLAPAGTTMDHFGLTADLSGDIAVIGAQDHSGGVERAGAAYVFSRSGNVWINATMLTASDRATHDYLGQAVAAGTGLVLAGVPGDDDRGTSSGSVRVFSGSGTSWTQAAKLTAFDGTTGDQFGMAVALDSASALVGSPYDDDLGSSSGSAYLYSRSGTSFSIMNKLLASDGASSDQFGASVAVDGAVALVGAPGDDDRASGSGSAYLFARTGSNWAFQQKLTAPDGIMDAAFGTRTAVSGTTAMVTAPGDLDHGAVYLFTRSGSTWRQLQKITASGAATNDNFGRGADLISDALLVGIPFDDDTGTDSGSAVFYGLACGNPAGAPCLSASACASGICEDQVCCSGPCGGSGDCQACSKYRGASEDGTCSLAKSGSICRDQAGICDIADTCNGSNPYCPGDSLRPPGYTCRSAAGTCDLAETCNGGSPLCPSDSFQSANTICRSASGVCDAEEKCTGSAASCPADAAEKAGIVCRPSVLACDEAETCDGTATTCPADKVKAATVVCRPAVSACDAAETCSGTTAACPTDQVATSSTVCRKAAGTCDIAETCNGSSTACPSDTVMASGITCRAVAGACDLHEVCDGSSGLCPIDEVKLNTETCRPPTGDCDVAENCDGLSTACPTDLAEIAGTICRLGFGLCDKNETCDGTSLTCPKDTLEPAGTVCRKAAGGCDKAESCDGTSLTCPKDGKMVSGAVCRKAAGDCDAAETCDGSSDACPSDKLASAGTVCRAATGDCDAAETCDGTKSACPGDALKAVGTTCRAAGGACDPAETCDGSSGSCPSDKLSSSGTVCRAATDLCDAAETCDGTTTGCPADLLKASGSTCRAAAGLCDSIEKCSGTTAKCPADLFKSLGLVCRAQIDECDFTEKCDGTAGKCPNNVTKPNGVSCLKGAGTCQNGRCITDAGVLDMSVESDMGSGDAGDLGGSDAEAGVADLDLSAGTDADGLEASAGDIAGSTDADGQAADISATDSAGGDAGDAPGDEEGCSCRTTGDAGAGWLLALMLAAVLLWRRRR